MGKKIAHGVFTALILLLCLIPSGGMLLEKTASPEETGGNETLAAMPGLRDRTGKLNREWLKQAQAYVEDHYFLRQEMITVWSRLNASLLHHSITEDVILGKDGWLYFGGTLSDYTGLNRMTEREVYAAGRNLALMAEFCEREGRQFLFTIAPNKNTLYPEHMPDLLQLEGPRNRDLLAEALEREGVPYCDLFARFQGENRTLYFPRDSHWDSQGAALAADALNEALGRNSDYFAGHFSPTPNHKGDLYAMLYPAGEEMELDAVYQESYLGGLDFEYDAPIRSAENLTILTHSGGEGSLLMFRDSFGNLLYPYLAHSFGAALFSRSVPYRLDLAAERDADYVVLELVERNLRNLTESVPVAPAPERPAAEPASLSAQSVEVRASASEELAGYVLAEGVLPGVLDPESPVLVETAQGWYEACLLGENGFGLYLPEGAEIQRVAAFSGGEEVAFAALILTTD